MLNECQNATYSIEGELAMVFVESFLWKAMLWSPSSSETTNKSKRTLTEICANSIKYMYDQALFIADDGWSLEEKSTEIKYEICRTSSSIRTE